MIEDGTLDAVAALVTEMGPGEAALAELRRRFEALHFTLCSDDDIGSVEPVRETPDFNVYLVEGRDRHCLALGGDAAAATGLVIAWREDG